jgi:hypothetical protein
LFIDDLAASITPPGSDFPVSGININPTKNAAASSTFHNDYTSHIQDFGSGFSVPKETLEASLVQGNALLSIPFLGLGF